MIKNLYTVQLFSANISQNTVVSGQLNDKVKFFALQKGGVIGCRWYAEALCMPSANCLFIDISHTKDMSLQVNRGVRIEKVKDVIASFSTTDKGHIEDLLAHTG